MIDETHSDSPTMNKKERIAMSPSYRPSISRQDELYWCVYDEDVTTTTSIIAICSPRAVRGEKKGKEKEKRMILFYHSRLKTSSQ